MFIELVRFTSTACLDFLHVSMDGIKDSIYEPVRSWRYNKLYAHLPTLEPNVLFFYCIYVKILLPATVFFLFLIFLILFFMLFFLHASIASSFFFPFPISVPLLLHFALGFSLIVEITPTSTFPTWLSNSDSCISCSIFSLFKTCFCSKLFNTSLCLLLRCSSSSSNLISSIFYSFSFFLIYLCSSALYLKCELL